MQGKQSVARNDQIIGAGLSDRVRPIVLFVQTRDAQGWGKSRGFDGPVRAHRSGCNHECRTACGPMQQQRQGLHGFTEPHVIGQTSAGTPVGQTRHPDKAVNLVGAQLGAKRRWDGRHQIERAAHPLESLLPGRIAFDLRLRYQLVERKCCDGINPHDLARPCKRSDRINAFAQFAGDRKILTFAKG